MVLGLSTHALQLLQATAMGLPALILYSDGRISFSSLVFIVSRSSAQIDNVTVVHKNAKQHPCLAFLLYY